MDPAKFARVIASDELPGNIQRMVDDGWFAVVYKCCQVYGIFPQRILAAGYVAAVSKPEDRNLYQIVGKG